MKKSVGILIFNEVEVLDFAGPFEVFSVASEVHNFELFEVFTIAKELKPVIAVNGLSVNPKYDFKTAPLIDILIICGGAGTRKLLKDKDLLNWVNAIYKSTEITVSICSGARILGELGLLNGKPYCTHHQVYDHMEELVVNGVPRKDRRFIKSDNKIYTSSGISAGIDLSFHIVERLYGEKVAKETAEYMEYNLLEKE